MEEIMMHEPKPLASLSSGLLARKGGAKPAMRRPNLVQAELGAPMDDDLGWNDMGYDVNPSHSSGDDIVTHFQQNPLKNAIPEAMPAVRQQQDAIAERLRAEPVAEPVAAAIVAVAEPFAKAAPEPIQAAQAVFDPQDQRVERAGGDGTIRKAAFTLRLDADRHLRLRLASTIENLSAQRLVTKAVDEYLKSIPELDDLTQRMPLRQVR
jgi:hypothetical protein